MLRLIKCPCSLDTDVKSHARAARAPATRAPDSVFHKPLRWVRPRRVFVNSLSDMFHPGVSDELLINMFDVMRRCPQHTFLVLTKRPKRMRSWLNQYWASPLHNVWVGVSIESNKYAWRADMLRDTPAAVRWVSAEPLIGSLNKLDLNQVDWVVAGGESGAKARPMHPAWVRDLRDRCTNENTAFFFKQWGAWAPYPRDVWDEDHGGTRFVKLNGSLSWAAGNDDYLTNWSPNYEPSDHPVTRARSPRILDGRTWDEYPDHPVS